MADSHGKGKPVAEYIPPVARLHLWHIQAVRDVLWVAAVVLIIWLGYALRMVTVPLLVAMLLAYLFEPLVARLSSMPRMNRPIVVGGLLVVLLLAMAAVVGIGVPVIVSQSMRLVDDIREGQLERGLTAMRGYIKNENYRAQYEDALLSMEELTGIPLINPSAEALERKTAAALAATQAASQPQSAPGITAGSPTQVQQPVVVAPAGTSSASWLQFVRQTSSAMFSAIGDMLGIVLIISLIPFYFYFFSVGYPNALAFGKGMIPVHARPRVLDLLSKMDRAVAGFVRGRIIISLLDGLILAIGWMIVDVPKGFLVGMVTGLFTLVPYLGGLGLPIAIGLMAIAKMGGAAGSAEWSWWWILLAPTVVFIVMQLIENYILIPFIAGKATNLGPVSILVAVLAGGSLMGVYGMILSIPMAACLKILMTDVVYPRIKAWMRGEVSDPLPLG